VWPRGDDGLIGDSLGPVMHLHNRASEIFYFVSGQCRLEVGNSEEFFGPGDFVLVPPEVPHNLWNAGDDDLIVFWLVAPNFATNKWHTDHFPSGAMDRRVIRSQVAPGVDLPSDANIRSRLLMIEAGAKRSGHTAQRQEAILYIVNGQAGVQVGKLGGTLVAHDFVHVPAGTAYIVMADDGPVSFLLFEMPGEAKA
jgi:quercetin dioxygenase-like cupin family protein